MALEHGKFRQHDMDIPVSWARSAAEIARRQWRRVLVIGAVDRGKSTYCRFLSQHLLAAGWRVAIVDADVGQKDIGPPAAITLGYPALAQPLTAVLPAAWYFVGAVSPVGHLLPMVVGTKQLVEVAQANCVIINTTGLVHGVGRVLKSYTIEAVQPHVIVAIEQEAELQALLTSYRNYRVLRLPPSPHAVAKTPEQRRMAREQAFQRYFQTASEVALPVRQLLFQRRYVPRDEELHVLCGVADRRNRGVGLAIHRGRQAPSDTLSLLTPVPARLIHVVQYGDLSLAPEGQELDRR
jgi:polynucleotide 5'-hydroxyl-kinase GRC3/NOL9